jgi:lipoprotein signal peptidase
MHETWKQGTILPECNRVRILIFFYGEEQSYEKHARIFMVTFIFAGSLSNGQLDRAADELGDDHIAWGCTSSGHCIYRLDFGGIYTS